MRSHWYGTPWFLIETWRRRGRFTGVLLTLGTLCTLAVVLVSLAAGLWNGATGAISSSSADLMVFSRSSLTMFSHSRVPLSDVSRIEGLPGIAGAGALGILPTMVSAPHGNTDVAIMGTIPGKPGGPGKVVDGRLPRTGEDAAAVDVSLRSDGVRLGTVLPVVTGGPPLRVVGFVASEQYQLVPTVWTDIGAWQALTGAAQPETRGGGPWAQVLTIQLAPGANAASVAASVTGRLAGSVVTRGQAMLAIPGATAMRSTLDQLIIAVLVVTALVTALFAALYTSERTPELARLRALGASARRLATGLLLQVEVPVIIAAVIAYLITVGMLAAVPPSFPASLPFSRAAEIGAFILLAGALGTALATVRIVRIDPATALEER